MEKVGIQSSTLAQDLCSLFDGKDIGGADEKVEAFVIDKQVSIIGNLPADTPEKFAHYLGQNTTEGLFDRFIFAVPEREFRYSPPEVREAAGLHFDCACRVPLEYFEQMLAWRQKSPQTRTTRLGEILLRVAVISASVNGDDAIGPKSFWAAAQFAEWQERVRTKYQPEKARNLRAELTTTILGKLAALTLDGKSVQVEDGKPWIRSSRFAICYRLYEELAHRCFGRLSMRLCSDKAISYKMKNQRLIHIGPASNGVFGSEAEKEEGAS